MAGGSKILDSPPSADRVIRAVTPFVSSMANERRLPLRYGAYVNRLSCVHHGFSTFGRTARRRAVLAHILKGALSVQNC